MVLGLEFGGLSKNEVEERGEEVNVEGVGKAGEEVERDEEGDDDRGEEGADEAEFEEDGDKLVLDDFFGGVDSGGAIHGGAGATEANTKNKICRRRIPNIEGGFVKFKANISRFGDIAVEKWLV